jgi:hypothetical protein
VPSGLDIRTMGVTEIVYAVQASLRDAIPYSPLPGVKTPGYYQRSLRDKVAILVRGTAAKNWRSATRQ